MSAAVTWELEIQVHADYTTENIGTPALEFTFVAADSGDEAGVVTTADCQTQPWELPYRVGGGADSIRHGAVLSKEFQLPDGFGLPGALLVTKAHSNLKIWTPKIDRVYLATVRVWPKGSEEKAIPFLTNSWVADGFGGRIFFTGAAKLPNQTPDGLVKLRKQELANLRGLPDAMTTERTAYERIYDYDVYNDLVGPEAKTNPAKQRVILGKAGGGMISYPRRLRTGRNIDPVSGDEHLPTGATPWLPLDEMFFAAKQEEFDGGKIYSLAEAVGAAVELLLNGKAEVTRFEGIAALESLYTREVPSSRQDVKPGADSNGPHFNFNVNKLKERFSDFPEELRKAILKALQASQWPGHILSGVNNKIISFIEGLVSIWPLPLVRDQRCFTWHSDEEMGRQTVAGFNPFTIKIATMDLFKGISKITAEDLHGLLGGLTLEQAINDKRVFWQDYHTVIAKDIAPRVKDGYQYAGRGVFFKDPATGALSIVAIELQAPGEGADDARVFTRLSDSLEIWQLAKAVYSSLDFLVHELVSHFAQTHAVMEPFAIATRRQLSAMHPVYQLMMPHYHYTMQINAAARAALINVDGIVEKVFTAGPLCMEFSARMYEQSWAFVEQGLPVDLASRGLAEVDANNKVTLILKDFPYAEDGLLVWEALVKYFTGYLNIHYSDSGTGGKPKVVDDEELVAWWKEAREVGHADKPEGWISLTDIASLVQILATIAWIGSAHHAAVNFGQYAYAGYMPNKPSFVAKAIPARASLQERALLADFDFEYLHTLSDPFRTLQTMLLTKLLSTHAQDEFYLSGPQTDWISDPEAVALKEKFERDLVKAEEAMIQRNAQATSRARHEPTGVPYTLLYPSATNPVTTDNMGMTGCGIPYSVSI